MYILKFQLFAAAESISAEYPQVQYPVSDRGIIGLLVIYLSLFHCFTLSLRELSVILSYSAYAAHGGIIRCRSVISDSCSVSDAHKKTPAHHSKRLIICITALCECFAGGQGPSAILHAGTLRTAGNWQIRQLPARSLPLLHTSL